MTKLSRGEPFEGETLIADGWVYRDMPRGVQLDATAWEAFLTIIGFSNYRVLAFTKVTDKDGVVWKRGQFLISPAGMRNLINHAAQDSKKPPGG